MNKNGYTLLVLILVLMAIGLLIITTTNFLGIDKAKESVNRYQSILGFYLSTSCAEHALEIIRGSGQPTRVDQAESRVSIALPGDLASPGITSYDCWYSIQGEMPKYIRTRSGILDFPRPLEIKIINIERPPSRRIIIEYWLEK